MCTKQKLYEQMPREKRGTLQKSSQSLSSSQIDLATDCLRVLANRMGISIGEMSHLLRVRNLYPLFYRLLRRSPRISKMQLVNQMQRAL